MRIFHQSSTLPKDILEKHSKLLQKFNVFELFDKNLEFQDILFEVFERNDFGQFASSGRSKDTLTKNLIFGLGPEARMIQLGAIPDVRPYRDLFLERDGLYIPIDVKTKQDHHQHVNVTLSDMTEKLNGKFADEYTDLLEIFVWNTYQQDGDPRYGDIEFWKAFRIIDTCLL